MEHEDHVRLLGHVKHEGHVYHEDHVKYKPSELSGLCVARGSLRTWELFDKSSSKTP